MPYLEKNGRWGKKVDFTNLRGRTFEKVRVCGMIAFDLGDTGNAFWKCECACGRRFSASTHELQSLKMTTCGHCAEREEWAAEMILVIAKSEAESSLPVGAEVIFRGTEADTLGDCVRVEFGGKILSLRRENLRPTGEVF